MLLPIKTDMVHTIIIINTIITLVVIRNQAEHNIFRIGITK